MTPSLPAMVAALALVLLAGVPHPAHAAIPVPAAERAWTQWQHADASVWRQWRANALSPARRQALVDDTTAFPRALVDAGVLPSGNDHAWTSGCSPFATTLHQVAGSIQTPEGLERWRGWRAVYRVMCGPLPGERPAVEQAVARAQAWALPTPAPGAPSWPALLLDEVPDASFTCMGRQVPAALRAGLDRHEGLAFVAKACRLDSVLVFGAAIACDACLGHPRAPQHPGLYETWARVR